MLNYTIHSFFFLRSTIAARLRAVMAHLVSIHITLQLCDTAFLAQVGGAGLGFGGPGAPAAPGFAKAFNPSPSSNNSSARFEASFAKGGFERTVDTGTPDESASVPQPAEAAPSAPAQQPAASPQPHTASAEQPAASAQQPAASTEQPEACLQPPQAPGDVPKPVPPPQQQQQAKGGVWGGGRKAAFGNRLGAIRFAVLADCCRMLVKGVQRYHACCSVWICPWSQSPCAPVLSGSADCTSSPDSWCAFASPLNAGLSSLSLLGAPSLCLACHPAAAHNLDFERRYSTSFVASGTSGGDIGQSATIVAPRQQSQRAVPPPPVPITARPPPRPSAPSGASPAVGAQVAPPMLLSA